MEAPIINPKHLHRGNFFLKEDGAVGFVYTADGPWVIVEFPCRAEKTKNEIGEWGIPAANGLYDSSI